MLSAFRSALATPDLRRKILFTLGIVAVYRVGASLPSPGVSSHNVQLHGNTATSNVGSGFASLQTSTHNNFGGNVSKIAWSCSSRRANSFRSS